MYNKFLRTFRRATVMAIGGFRHTHLEVFGTVDQWACNPVNLNSESVVVSGGVGHHITFEKQLASKTGCQIFLFDPSPTGIETMKRKENLVKNILFSPLGLASEDGTQNFGVPDRCEEGSWKKLDGDTGQCFGCRSISSLAKEHRWERIDLLKIDIEGFEYEVLDDMLASHIQIDQICVEFHTNSMIDINKKPLDLIKLLLRLRWRGYKIAKIIDADFTLIHNKISNP